ncbi:hypothetical protein ACQPX6_12170 [Actinomycetospora sp. CA-101289]|uniref:hypothetical protein n=1 Tax=Actinomycetospora sp. CA-101289 TaxID=3239893 RepID=UPI003D961E37
MAEDHELPAETPASSSGDGGAIETSPTPEATPTAPATRSKSRRARVPRSFPASSFFEALALAEAIQKHAAGQRVRRLTLFERMGRSADSGASRQLVTNSNQYGITRGSYTAEWIELTDEGRAASSDDTPARTALAAQLLLAITRIDPFNSLYEQFKDNRVPSPAVLQDHAVEQGTAREVAGECVETFLANCRDLGLVRTYAGAERMLTIEHVVDEAGEDVRDSETGDLVADEDPGQAFKSAPIHGPAVSRSWPDSPIDMSDVCFLVSPIGAEGSEQREHANLVLGSLLEPALTSLGLRLVRADQISKPGMITGQVIEHIVKAPLVIADLSYSNPNVYYELALRHACRKPAVQVIRSSDRLPFDVGQFRTVTIDMTSIFTLVPQIDSYRAEIARQCRLALDEDGPAESPLSLFYPGFWDQYAR